MFSFLRRATFTMKTHCFGRNFCVSSFPLVRVPLPSQMETHLWYILPDEVNSASILNQYQDLLSPFEKENVLRMRGDEMKKRALLARALVRTTIARYQINPQVSARSLKFRKNIHGKPEVEWQLDADWSSPPMHFNISHTSSLIACGITVDSSIGIDVEEKQRTVKNNILSFARRYFSHQEVEHLTSISDPEVQRQEFIKLWTLKEAYVKALGRGFSAAPFKTFSIQSRASISPISNSEASEIVVESLDSSTNLTSNWQFGLLELESSHFAAICTEKNNACEGNTGNIPRKLTVWKTIPFVEDTCVSGTDVVKMIGGLT